MRRSTAERRRARLSTICLALSEAVASTQAGHVQFQVRGKTSAYYLDDHHGDGRMALCCKASPGQQVALVESYPARFFVPAYLGARGWVGLRLDLSVVDWGEVEVLVRDSYRLTGPKRPATNAG